ncbi:hypothetical protein PhCBS80983_g03669 [Powellomyces hirtus]|uniref:Protein kintoun n=1 Tax=Powellomyces hirtus TaxID=109895 RepID=A0A507E1I7_9FUNG|nr:hypothetical protein PhCBS80983_g03669 [Powellomyces hirtus]
MAATGEKPKTDITAEEFKKIEESLKNKEFRSLFMDYMQEISDPENRKLYEAELTQLESERGNDIRFVTPTPGHVIKTRVKTESGDGKKVFINMCTSTEIVAATPGTASPGESAKGTPWSIPYSLTKPRQDLDSAGKECTVYDCVFHPDTYTRGRVSTAFERLLVSTAIEGIEREFGMVLEKKYRAPRMTFKGTPVATVIRTPAAGSSQTNMQDPKAAFIDALKPNTSTALKSPHPPLLPVAAPNASATGKPPLIEELSPAAGPVSAPAPRKVVEPRYSITHRGVRADYQQYTQERERQRGARPDALVVRIELPTVRSSNDITLTPALKSLGLSVPGKYETTIPLPFEVNVERAAAVFEKDREVLALTLPVIPAPDACLPPSTASFEQDEEPVGAESDDGLDASAVQTPLGSEDADGWIKVHSPGVAADPPAFTCTDSKISAVSAGNNVEVPDELDSMHAAQAALRGVLTPTVPVVLSNTLMYDLDD